MRLLYVTADLPWPLTSGYLRHYHFIRALSERHEITLLSLRGPDHEPADIEALRPYVESIVTEPSARGPRSLPVKVADRVRMLMAGGDVAAAQAWGGRRDDRRGAPLRRPAPEWQADDAGARRPAADAARRRPVRCDLEPDPPPDAARLDLEPARTRPRVRRGAARRAGPHAPRAPRPVRLGARPRSPRRPERRGTARTRRGIGRAQWRRSRRLAARGPDARAGRDRPHRGDGLPAEHGRGRTARGGDPAARPGRAARRARFDRRARPGAERRAPWPIGRASR